MNYDKVAVSGKFDKGKALLDNGYNDEAIVIFSELIELSAPLKDSYEDAAVTWHTSLNNRGLARCNKGYSEGDKAIFEEGMKDYQTAVESESDPEAREHLTAMSNLRFAQKQLTDFDNRNRVQFKAI